MPALSGIPLTIDLGRYLGVPSIHGQINVDSLATILDRVNSRLEGWKTKYLSLAGRQVLAQSVLQAVPFYSMQSTLLPMGVCSLIEKKIRNFLWGGRDDKRGVNLVSWDTVLKKKSDGGLGLTDLHTMNLAFLAKLDSRMYQEGD
ncbi:hypothetical protein DITRI_Ditri04bG0154800 [Diplodiscus trichospermus]